MRFQRDKDPVTEQDLSDFADGELPRTRARRVAAHLRANPSDADRLHDYWRHEAELYRAFEPAFHESDTSSLADVKMRRPARTLSWAAVVGVLMLTAGLVQDRLEDGSPTSPAQFTAGIIEAYTGSPDSGQPDIESAPSLVDLDLQPVGARTVRLDDGREVVEYRYEDEQGTTVALYEMEASADDAGLFQIFERDDTRLVEWTMADKRYALVGKATASRLTHLAVQIRGNLITRPSGVERGLATEVQPELNVNGAGSEPVMVQSPGTGRIPAESVMLKQTPNEANGFDSGDGVNAELGLEGVESVKSEM